MNEELQKQLAAVISDLATGVKAGGEWVAGQTPGLIKEIIYWNIGRSIFCLVVFICLFILGVKSIPWAKKVWREFDGCPLGWLASVVAMIAGTIGTIENLSWAIKWIIAPHLALLEWAKSLLG